MLCAYSLADYIKVGDKKAMPQELTIYENHVILVHKNSVQFYSSLPGTDLR